MLHIKASSSGGGVCVLAANDLLPVDALPARLQQSAARAAGAPHRRVALGIVGNNAIYMNEQWVVE